MTMTAMRALGRRGFTMIEILVVVAIIVLIMAIVVPTVAGVRARAAKAAMEVSLRSVAQALQAYANDHGGYPPSQGNGRQMLAKALLGYEDAAVDGADSYGFRIRTGGRGQVYGPYMEPKEGVFDATQKMFVDSQGLPIYYFKAQNAASPNAIFSTSSTAIFRQTDNPPDPKGHQATAAAFCKLLGDANGNNVPNSGEAIMGSRGFLLVGAGLDAEYFTGDDVVVGQ